MRVFTIVLSLFALTGVALADDPTKPPSAPPWVGIAQSCRATPPLAEEQNAIPDGQTILVGTIIGYGQGKSEKNVRIALVYPGSSNKNYNSEYPYVCIVGGNWKASNAPSLGDWISVQGGTYSDYTLHGASAYVYTDPSISNISPTAGGSGLPRCDYNSNMTWQQVQVTQNNWCLAEAYSLGDCQMDAPYQSEWLYTHSHCSWLFNGAIGVTVCPDGTLWDQDVFLCGGGI
jgi:hypothetical protein